MPHLFPFLSFLQFAVHQRWPSETLVTKIQKRVPVLLLAGQLDEIVPHNHMLKLRDLFLEHRGENPNCVDLDEVKIEWHIFSTGKHNDTCIQPGYFDAIASFIKNI